MFITRVLQVKTLREIYNYETRADPRRTDKGRGVRNLIELYEQLFSAHRGSASKVFEIGVRRGGSIRMWRKYFPNATIYGLDIDAGAVNRVIGERALGIQIDQSDNDQLEAFGKQYGPFDIGIDDGSHIWSHQISTFERLWRYIRPGGLFVIEDTLTSYPIWLANSKSAQSIDYAQGAKSAVEYFKDLIDEINFDGRELDKSEYTEFQRSIDWIAFRHNSIFIARREDA
jgi:predicted O-methyltransferase YrrM